MIEGYSFSVRSRFEKEIWKRGLYSQQQDETGTVVKKRNEAGPSSFVGYGTVPDTLPALKKYHERMLNHFEEIMDQLVAPGQAPAAPEPPTKKRREIPFLRMWYDQIVRDFNSGCIGLIPAPFEKEVPPLEEIVESDGGQALVHFCGFVRKNFAE